METAQREDLSTTIGEFASFARLNARVSAHRSRLASCPLLGEMTDGMGIPACAFLRLLATVIFDLGLGRQLQEAAIEVLLVFIEPPAHVTEPFDTSSPRNVSVRILCPASPKAFPTLND